MALIPVQDPQTGKLYNVQIAGDTPTQQEITEIKEWLASQSQPVETTTPIAETTPAEEPGFFESTAGAGIDQIQALFGSAAEGVGNVTGFDGLRDWGREVNEANEAEYAEKTQNRQQLEDVGGVGDFAKFAGESVVEQLPQLGMSLAAGYAGGKAGAFTGGAIGSFAGPAGIAIGAGIGATVGSVGGMVAANLPFIYGSHREAQKDQIEAGVQTEVDEGVAFLTAIPATALETIAEKVMVGKFLTPKLINSGGIFTRVTKNAATGALVEAPTELGQQVIERAQAGKDLLSDDAFKEYGHAALVGGLVGSSVKGTGGAFTKDQRKVDLEQEALKRSQLEQDEKVEDAQLVGGFAAAQKEADARTEDEVVKAQVIQQGRSVADDERARKKAEAQVNSGTQPIKFADLDPKVVEEINMARQAAQAAGMPIGTPRTTTVEELRGLGLNEAADVEFKRQKDSFVDKFDRNTTERKFSQEQYDKAKAKILESGKADDKTIIESIKETLPEGQDKVPVTLIEEISQELALNRVIETNNGKDYNVAPEGIRDEDAAEPLRQRVSRSRARLDAIQAKVKELETLYDQQATINQTPDQKSAARAELSTQLQGLNVEAKREEADIRNTQRQIDTIDAQTGANEQIGNIRHDQAQARLAFSAAKEAAKAPKKADYETRMQKLVTGLQSYLKGIGLGDVNLTVQSLLEPDKIAGGQLVEGYYESSNKLIALATDLYDPTLSDAEYEARLRAVLNHEIIHAMRDVGVFTDAEWNTLTNAAAKRKYNVIINGKPLERLYTFMERETRRQQFTPPERMDGETQEDYDIRSEAAAARHQDLVEEEAVAEMFRAWTDGRLKLGGKPQSLFKRMISFLSGVGKAHYDEDITASDQIFEGIVRGDMASREFKVEPKSVPETAPEEAKMYSYGRVFPDNLSTFEDEIITIDQALDTHNFPQNVQDKLLGYTKTEDDADIREGTVVTVRLNLNGRTFLGPDAEAYKNEYNSQVAQINRSDAPAWKKDGMKSGLPFGLNKKYEGTTSTAIQTAHQGRNPKGKALAYAPAVTVRDVTFLVDQGARASISTGLANKFPMAGVAGNIAHGVNSTRGVEVKFNPFKHHVFVASFPQADGTRVEVPIKSAEEATVYGNTVYVRGKLEFYEDGELPVAKTSATGTLTRALEGDDPANVGNKVTKQTNVPSYNFDLPENAQGVGVISDFLNQEDIGRKYSIRQLTPELAKLSILHRLDEDGNFKTTYNMRQKADGTYGIDYISKGEALHLLQSERGNAKFEYQPRKGFTKEAEEEIAIVMAAEAEAALNRDGNAIGWYDRTLKLAKKMLTPVFPEIATDPAAEAVFDFALAVTSNGIAVVQNFKYAAEQYKAYQRTGRFPIKGYGDRDKAMRKAFLFYNAMRESGKTEIEIAEFLDQDTTPKLMDQNSVLQELGITAPAGEGKNSPVKMSFVIGPKIGQGFYQNLRGNYDVLTMDIWWMRMYNRITGNPFKDITNATLDKGRNDVLKLSKAALKRSTDPSEVQSTEDYTSEDLAYEAQLVQDTLKAEDIDIINKDNVDQVTLIIESAFQKAFRDAPTDARPTKTDLFKRTGTHTENLGGDVEQAAPRGSTDRTQQRRIAKRALDILEENTGTRITMADFQALMWYPEKLLFRSVGVRPGQGSDSDYVDGVIDLLREEGITDGQIEEALPTTDRHRINPDVDPRRQDGGVREGVADDRSTSDSKKYSGRILARNLRDFIKQNPDGYTITTGGGFADIDGKYAVAPLKSAEIISGNTLPTSVLLEYIEQTRQISEIYGTELYLGGWLNSENSKFYLDSTMLVDELDTALYIADAGQQEGIFDFNTFEEVRTQNGINQLRESGTYRSELAERYLRDTEEADKQFTSARAERGGRFITAEQIAAERREELLTISSVADEDYAFTEFISPEMEQMVRQIDNVISAQGSEQPSRLYASRPVRQFAPVANAVAQRRMDNGEDVNMKLPNVHGYMVDNFQTGEQIPVYLFAGDDVNPDDDGVSGDKNHGLFHIIQRNHDKELIEQSKYPSVQQAIYDLLKKWESQGYRDGSAVVAMPTGNFELALEWNNDVPRKSGPLKLVLTKARDKSGKPFYYIKTFYPFGAEKKKSVRTFNPQLLSTTAYTPIVNNMVGQAENNITYTASLKYLSKFLYLPAGLNMDRARDWSERLITQFQDRFVHIGKIVDEMKANGVTVTDMMDTYLQESLSHGVISQKISERENTLYNPLAKQISELEVTEAEFTDLKNASNRHRNPQGGSPFGFVETDYTDNKSKALTLAEAYLYALHAKERNSRIRLIDPTSDSGSGMSDAEADAILNQIAQMSPETQQKLSEIRSSLQNIIKDTNSVRVDSGLVSSDMVNGVANDPNDPDSTIDVDEFSDYIPLRGKFDVLGEANEEGNFGATRTPLYGARGREDKQMLGREYSGYATSIVVGAMQQNQNSIIRGERNKVGQSFLRLLLGQQDAEGNPIPEDQRAEVQRVMSQYAYIMDQYPMRRILDKNGRVASMPDPRAKEGKLVVKMDGQEFIVDFHDPRIGQAMIGMSGSPEKSNGLVRGMFKLNRYLSTINTTYNPSFFFTNIFRDVQTAGVNINQFEREGLTREMMANTKQAWKAVRAGVVLEEESSITRDDALQPGFDINSVSDADLFKLFQIFGGQNALNQTSSLQDQIENIDSILGDIPREGFKGAVKDMAGKYAAPVKRLGKFLEDYNTVAENMMRVATFKALAPRVGMEKAAFAARNITVDFSKGGEQKTLLNAMYLFYNASMQGSFAILNALARSRRVQKIWAGIVVAGMLQDQLNAMLSEEDEDGDLVYDNLQQWRLENNIMIPLSNKKYIQIPLPYGLNAAFNMGRSLSRFSRGQYSIGQAGSTILGTATDVFNPFGGNLGAVITGEAGAELGNVIAPTILDPVVDVLYDNTDFKASQIAKKPNAFDPTPTPNSHLYWSTTDQNFVKAAKFVNELTGGSSVEKGFIDPSPDVMEHLYQFITGGAGSFAARIGNFGINVAPAALQGDFEEDMIRSTPIARRFIGYVGERGDTEEFFNGRDKVLLAGEVLKNAYAVGNMEEVEGVKKRFAKELRIYGAIKNVNNARNRILRKMAKIKDNPRIPKATKDAAIKKLSEQVNAIVMRGNQYLNQYDIQ